MEFSASSNKKWNIIHAVTPEGQIRTGVFDVSRAKKLITGSWTFYNTSGQPDAQPFHCPGIGLSFQDYMMFSRTCKNGWEPGKKFNANFVYYVPIGKTGSLSAIWTEPKIYYEASSGIAVGGKPGILGSDYRVTYYYPGGVKPVTFDLSIALVNEASNIYSLQWYDRGNHILTGTGIKVRNGIAVAYNKPGTEAQLVLYKVQSEDFQSQNTMPLLNGQYSSTESKNCGTEIIINQAIS